MSGPAAKPINQVFYQYSTGSVTTATWTQILSSTSAEISELEIFDSSGSALILGYGSSGKQQTLIYVFPGGMSSRIKCMVPLGRALWLKALDVNTGITGEFIMNCYTR